MPQPGDPSRLIQALSALLPLVAVTAAAILAAHALLSRLRLRRPAISESKAPRSRSTAVTAAAGRPSGAQAWTMARVAPSENGFLPAAVPNFDEFGGQLQRVVEVKSARERGGERWG